jgi:hypothetical protein
VQKIIPFRWQQWVALAIVTWAMMDLTVPGLCPTELGTLQSGTPLSSELATKDTEHPTTAPQLISASITPSSGDHRSLDDDCWCCSSHVAPAPRFQATNLATLSYQTPPVFENLSTGWRFPLYLPPRS